MTRPSINIDADAFLSTYWQQSPQLLRQAFNPEQLISGDELAGLAMEPEVESRLIKHLPESDEWLLRHGPFAEEDFAELGPEKLDPLGTGCGSLGSRNPHPIERL